MENLVAAPTVIAAIAGVLGLAKILVARTRPKAARDITHALLVKWWVCQLRSAGASDKDVRRFVEKYALAGPGST